MTSARGTAFSRAQARQGSLFGLQTQVFAGLPPADRLMRLHFLAGGPYLCARCADYLAGICPGEGREGWLPVRACFLRSEAAEEASLRETASAKEKGPPQAP